jgi:hypothetical protein
MNPARTFTRWLHDRKDASVSFVLEKAMQNRLEKFGRVLELRIDTRRSTFFVELLLKGEKEPLTLTIEEYQINDEGGQTWITVKKCTASREWLCIAIEEYLVNKPFPIPKQYAGWAKMLL